MEKKKDNGKLDGSCAYIGCYRDCVMWKPESMSVLFPSYLRIPAA